MNNTVSRILPIIGIEFSIGKQLEASSTLIRIFTAARYWHDAVSEHGAWVETVASPFQTYVTFGEAFRYAAKCGLRQELLLVLGCFSTTFRQITEEILTINTLALHEVFEPDGLFLPPGGVLQGSARFESIGDDDAASWNLVRY